MAEKKPASAEASASKEKLNSEELEKKIEELEKQKAEYLAGWQRARADLLNYKKEEMERVGDILKYAGESLILKMLPILDNFEVAEKNLPEDLKNNESVKGLLQIKKQIQDFLKSQGVEEIKSVGEKFDPNLHEVVEEVEPASAEASASKQKGKESGLIIEEIQKGYKLNNRLLRAAKVKLAKFCIFASVIISSVSNISPQLCDKKCREVYIEPPHINENYYHNDFRGLIVSGLNSSATTASGTPVLAEFRTAKTIIFNGNIVINFDHLDKNIS